MNTDLQIVGQALDERRREAAVQHNLAEASRVLDRPIVSPGARIEDGRGSALGLLPLLAKLVAGVVHALKSRHVERITYRQLDALSDASLRDIGIHRFDIDRVAKAAAKASTVRPHTALTMRHLQVTEPANDGAPSDGRHRDLAA